MLGEKEGTYDLANEDLGLMGRRYPGRWRKVPGEGVWSMWSDPGGTTGRLENPEGERKGRVLVRYVVRWQICNAHM